MMGYRLLYASISWCLALFLFGCEGLPRIFKESPPVAKVVEASYSTADSLINGAGSTLSKKKPLIAATFVNIDDLEQTSSFGRIVSKQVASRFTQRGFAIIEMLFRHNVFIKQDSGEFLLSRELRNISSEHNAQAVIVGTYAIGRKTVYVNSLLIRAVDSIVLASHDYTLPIDMDMTFLLQSR